jgi:hypothetical protein
MDESKNFKSKIIILNNENRGLKIKKINSFELEHTHTRV